MQVRAIKLIDLAKLLNAKLHGNGDIMIDGVASLSSANTGKITFLAHPKFRKYLHTCQASAIVITKDDLIFCKISALIVPNPYLAYVKIVKILYALSKKTRDLNIGIGSVIKSNVKLGKGVIIGDNTVIESGVMLGNDVVIGSGSIIGSNTKINNGTQILFNVVINHEVQIGKNCMIKSGAILGSDGFGHVNDDGTWIKVPHLGKVIIGDNVEIGSCTTIDKGSLDNTYINNDVIIDNQCHIAHNVVIGKNTAIAGGVIIAGSSSIGNNCMIGGASVINGHIQICDQVTITGMSMVIKSITKPGIYSSGILLQRNQKWKRTAILMMNIDNINKRIKNIEQKLSKKQFIDIYTEK